MKKSRGLNCSRWMIVITVLSLSMLWSMSVPPVASAAGPGDVCVVGIEAGGDVLAIFTDVPVNFNIAVLVPPDKTTNVPVACDGLGTLGLGVANQANRNVLVSVLVFDHKGVLFCVKDAVKIRENGARGFTFADCPPVP